MKYKIHTSTILALLLLMLSMAYAGYVLTILTVRHVQKLFKPDYKGIMALEYENEAQYKRDCERLGGNVVYSALNYPDCLPKN